jgi:hypothetical protein
MRLPWSSYEVLPPFSAQQLLALSDQNIIRLLNFYVEDQSYKERNHIWWSSIYVPVLRTASCMDPNRFIERVLYSKDPYLSIEYIPTLIEGFATHLRCRFGNLSDSEWYPLKPLPDGINLAKDLLKMLEQFSISRIGGDASSKALLACCSVLIDDECADRLSLQLFWLYETHINEIKQIYSNRDELIGKMINSVCGVVAEAAICLHNRLLESNLNVPELLTCLIEKSIKDKRDYVRVAILRHLPFIIYKQPTRGWELLSDIFKGPETLLWQYTEQCLYHNYRHNFGMISPYIDRLFREGMKEAGDTWGRISALSVLAGYIDADQLFEQLQLVPDCEPGWEGISQVFTANLHISEHKETCCSGILKILEIKRNLLPQRVLLQISKCFHEKINIDNKTRSKNIEPQILSDILEKILTFCGMSKLDNFDISQYLSELSRVDPIKALKLSEILASKLKEEVNSYIHDSKYLTMALKEIFAEAEDSQDMSLTNRAIALQDLFLEINIHGMDDFLDKSARH